MPRTESGNWSSFPSYSVCWELERGEPPAEKQGSLVPGKTGCVDILDAVRACVGDVERATARVGATASLAMPAFIDPVMVDQAKFRRAIVHLVNEVLSGTPSGGKLSVSFSLPRPDTLAIEVEADTAAGAARRTAHLPIQRSDG